MGKYSFLDHTADIAIRIQADNLEDLFATAWEAWRNIVFENQPLMLSQQRLFEVEADSVEELLVESLKEINYFYLVKGLIFLSCDKLAIKNNRNNYILHARLNFDIFDAEKYQPAAEIKAVTYHRLNIKNLGNQLQTDIVFDI
jgi:SHS2 domain-containing protein